MREHHSSSVLVELICPNCCLLYAIDKAFWVVLHAKRSRREDTSHFCPRGCALQLKPLPDKAVSDDELRAIHRAEQSEAKSLPE